MTGLVILVLIVIVVIVLIARSRARQKEEPVVVDPLRRDSRGFDPRELKVGDVVHHENRDYLVRGTLAFDEDGFVWSEHLLDDTTGRLWLSVEDDEELELVMWRRVDAPELQPGEPHLTHDGVEYSLEEQGSAKYTAKGATGTPAGGQAEYADYASGDRRLSFERFSGERWEISVGEVVSERSIDIYPSAST